ncbi:hypothetical protein OAX78_01930 [Planctomycetota bacterium]|nr:hypothetical protein [Planctomycetota bacterium]
MNKTLALCTLAAVVTCGAAGASQVDRSQVTLSRLTDASDLIVVADVTATGDPVRLSVHTALRGSSASEFDVPAGEVTWRAGDRVLAFLSLDASGAARMPHTSACVVVLPNAATAAALTRAVQERLPRLGGDPAVLRASQFDALTSPLARLREDAAYELLAYADLNPTAAEVAALVRGVELHPSVPAAELAGRLRRSEALIALLQAGRNATDPILREVVGHALGKIDAVASVDALTRDLAASTPTATAAGAVELIGIAGGLDAQRSLGLALRDARPMVREAALRALATSPSAKSAAPSLEQVAQTGSPNERRLALAALARAGAGDVLRRIAKDHADPTTRALADQLRADPSGLAEQILAE